MMLHLGGGAVVPLAHIVAILDLDAAQGAHGQPFLREYALPPDAKAAVIINANGKTRVLPSAISAPTLMRRSFVGLPFALLPHDSAESYESCRYGKPPLARKAGFPRYGTTR
jgi:hypothetical protein